VHMIYGYFLSKTGEGDSALQHYIEAVELMPNSAEANYNLGLLYAETSNYPLARKHAYVAYDLGFPLPGLRRILERAGEWGAPENGEPMANE